MGPLHRCCVAVRLSLFAQTARRETTTHSVAVNCHCTAEPSVESQSAFVPGVLFMIFEETLTASADLGSGC